MSETCTPWELLVSLTSAAIQSGKLKEFGRDDMMRLFLHYAKRVPENEEAIKNCLSENQPYEPGNTFLRDIYNDAVKNPFEIKPEKPKKSKRINPDILTNDTAPDYYAQVPGSLVRDTSVSCGAFRLYVLLMLRAGKKGGSYRISG